MHRRRILIVFVLLAFAAGCSSGNDATIDAGTDAGVDSGNDAGVDGADAGPEPTSLPLGPEAVGSLGEGGGIDVGSAGWVAADGTILVIWEHFDAEFTRGELLLTTSGDAISWSAPAPLAFGAAVFQASPSLTGRGERVDLYLVRSGGIYDPAEIAMSRRSGDTFGLPRVLPAIPGLAGLLSWPRFYALDGAGTAVAFRSGTGQPQVAFSTDGVDFDPPVEVSTQAAAMPALGRFEAGGFAYTYQTGSGGSMASWVSNSPDGIAWSDPTWITDASTNVHDTTLVPRLDGELDLYYVYPCSAAGFCLFRRSLDPEGNLGAEQQVTLPEVGEVSKPEGLRLLDGRLLLLWAEITVRGAGGHPVEQILKSATVRGDAH